MWRTASVVVACGLSSCSSQALECRLSSCGPWAYLLRGMWDLPGPGLKPVSPALAGGFLTAAPPGKSPMYHSCCCPHACILPVCSATPAREAAPLSVQGLRETSTMAMLLLLTPSTLLVPVTRGQCQENSFINISRIMSEGNIEKNAGYSINTPRWLLALLLHFP